MGAKAATPDSLKGRLEASTHGVMQDKGPKHRWPNDSKYDLPRTYMQKAKDLMCYKRAMVEEYRKLRFWELAKKRLWRAALANVDDELFQHITLGSDHSVLMLAMYRSWQLKP